MRKLLQMFWGLRNRTENQTNRGESELSPISIVELVALFGRIPDSLMVFDLRDAAEIEKCPCAIPRALLTFNVNLEALVPWIPPETVVVLYGTVDIPARYALIHRRSPKVRFHGLRGGLQSWRKNGQPIEQVVVGDQRSVDG